MALNVLTTTHHSQKYGVKLYREVHYICWGNKYLELQQWKDFINITKTRILAIIVVVTKKNPQGYKEHAFFIAFALGEGFTIINLQKNMKLYVSDIEESYKDTIIGNLVNAGTSDLLLLRVQCWC